MTSGTSFIVKKELKLPLSNWKQWLWPKSIKPQNLGEQEDMGSRKKTAGWSRNTGLDHLLTDKEQRKKQGCVYTQRPHKITAATIRTITGAGGQRKWNKTLYSRLEMTKIWQEKGDTKLKGKQSQEDKDKRTQMTKWKKEDYTGHKRPYQKK